MTAAEYNHIFKTIIIGDNGVGKSSILRAYLDETFTYHYTSTIGVDFEIKKIKIDDKMIKLHIWDTAGSERFKTIVRSYYKSCIGYVVVFDITNEESFYNIEKWIDDVSENIYEVSEITFILVGNKSDLSNRRVTYSEGQALADKLGIEYIETSAKKFSNIQLVYDRLAKNIYEKMKSGKLVLEDNIINLKNSFSIMDNEYENKNSISRFFKCC